MSNTKNNSGPGAPVTVFTPKKVEEIKSAFAKYIKETPIPIVTEFAYQQGLHRQQLYRLEELSDTIKICTTKKEAALQRKAFEDPKHATFCIFSLKQLGWKDNKDINFKGKLDLTDMSDDELNQRIKDLEAKVEKSGKTLTK